MSDLILPSKKGLLGSGIYVEPQTGTLLYFRRQVGGRIASTLMVIMIPVIKDGVSRHIVAEIHNMWTKPRHRNNGYMGELVEAVKGSMRGQVRYIITSWNDSSKQGREFLLKRGFERKGSTLIWRDENWKGGDGDANNGKAESSRS
jgi:hypothetical protein